MTSSGAPGARLASAQDGVVFALLGARVIVVLALTIGHVHVGLLDARQHLRIERFLKRRGGRHDRPGVGVLALQVRAHPGVVLVSQPMVVVHALPAVDGGLVRDALCLRRLQCLGIVFAHGLVSVNGEMLAGR